MASDRERAFQLGGVAVWLRPRVACHVSGVHPEAAYRALAVELTVGGGTWILLGTAYGPADRATVKRQRLGATFRAWAARYITTIVAGDLNCGEAASDRRWLPDELHDVGRHLAQLQGGTPVPALYRNRNEQPTRPDLVLATHDVLNGLAQLHVDLAACHR
jgi:hypothetical protein